MTTQTQTAHTPGPWAVQTLSGTWHDYHDWKTFAIRSPENYNLAMVGEQDHATAPRNEANAHLIAAAPDLLAACKLALDSFGGLDTNHLTAVEWREYNALTLAIQKAGGM